MDSRPRWRSPENVKLRKRLLLLPLPTFPSLSAFSKKAGKVPQEDLACSLFPGPSPFQTHCSVALIKHLCYKVTAATQNIYFPFQIQASTDLKDSNPGFAISLYPIPRHHSPRLQHSPWWFWTMIGVPEWTTKCFRRLEYSAKERPQPWASQRKGFSPRNRKWDKDSVFWWTLSLFPPTVFCFQWLNLISLIQAI